MNFTQKDKAETIAKIYELYSYGTILNSKQYDIIMKGLSMINHDDKTKAKMTRAEAIACFSKHMPHINEDSVPKTIDFYIEAGMLEIIEEKEPVILGYQFKDIVTLLNEAGYIVTKARLK